jgi:protein-S-isoprenylcysteine O-methyltransferase Ste14
MHVAAVLALIAIWVGWLLAFFFAQRTGEKAVVTAPVARWGIGLQGLAYALAWFAPPQYWSQPRQTWVLVLGLLCAIAGIVSAWLSVRHLGKQWRVQAGLNADHELIRSGPYRLVRHPIYASMLAMLLAAGLIVSWPPLFPVAFVIFILGTEIRVRAEDRLLASRFHEQFAAYRASVPAYIPFVR